jgi:hypothetical protein
MRITSHDEEGFVAETTKADREGYIRTGGDPGLYGPERDAAPPCGPSLANFNSPNRKNGLGGFWLFGPFVGSKEL